MSKFDLDLRLERQDRTGRGYIPPKPKPKTGADLNLNPFSTKGGLDRLSFLATLAIVVVLLYLLNFVIRGPLQLARASLDSGTAMQWYVAKIVVSLVGFWIISAAYIKRWNAILGQPVPGFTRNLMRLFLLSPLLSIWFTLFTLINGPLLRGARFIAGIATLILFHFGFVGWMIYSGTVTAGPGLAVHLAEEVSPARSLDEVLPPLAPRPWVPTETFVIHFEPYLSPVWKLSVSLYSDYMRMKAISEEASVPDSPMCREKLGYIGQPVNDCFFYNFRKAGESRAFNTPALASIFESQHEKELPSSLSPQLDPMAKIAPALLSVKNLLTMMEFGPGRRSYREFLKPIGLLSLFSSPEIAIMEASQDAQRMAFARKILPSLKPQVEIARKNAQLLGGQLSRVQAIDLDIEIADIAGRMDALERDPLGVRQSFDDVDGGGKKAGAPSKE